MKQDKFKIIDESGDKKYFTIIPNYILNHSTAIDQALYLQMKRYAGENGKCFASEKTLINQLGIGRKALKKSLEYLLSHKWIELTGKKPVKTRGGYQSVNVYSVIDIWKLNSDNYNKGVSEREPLTDTQGVSESNQRGVQKEAKGVSQRATEEEPYIKNNQEEESNSRIAEVINLFKDINPSYKGWFGNTTQRKAVATLLEAHGFEKVSKAVSLLARTNSIPFITTITTPYMLEKNWALWKAQVEKKMAEKEIKQRHVIT